MSYNTYIWYARLGAAVISSVNNLFSGEWAYGVKVQLISKAKTMI